MLPLLHAAACALLSFKILRSFSKHHLVKQERFSNEYKLGYPAVSSTELCDEYFNLFHRSKYYGLVSPLHHNSAAEAKAAHCRPQQIEALQRTLVIIRVQSSLSPVTSAPMFTGSLI